jgi:hypothetical protein
VKRWNWQVLLNSLSPSMIPLPLWGISKPVINNSPYAVIYVTRDLSRASGASRYERHKCRITKAYTVIFAQGELIRHFKPFSSGRMPPLANGMTEGGF